MTKNTNIEWADHTFNPWEGCQKIGPGCDHCYAEARNARFGGGVAVNWGPGAPRRRTSAANWRQPLKWAREACLFRQCNDCGWRGTMKGMLCMQCHSADTREARQRVFCASLADVFDNEVDPQWRQDLFELIAATTNLDWLLLTKRIGNTRTMLPADWYSANFEPYYPNVWLGATIVNQEEADRDIPKLLATPATKRFLSIEPMLGPISLTSKGNIPADDEGPHRIGYMVGPDDGKSGLSVTRAGALKDSGIDWIICGGESGPNARPMHPDWARGLRDQCQAAGVPFLFKQWGEWKPISQMDEAEHRQLYVSKARAKPHQDQRYIDDIYGKKCTVPSTVIHLDGSTHDLAEPMTFRQGTGAMQIFKVGKKAAGRMLDGRTWDGFPCPP